MHELSIASSIVDSVQAFMEEHPVQKILEVRVSVGELTCIEHEQLRFSYMAITKRTELEDSRLQLETVKALVKCPHCAYEGRPKYWNEALSIASLLTLECPECSEPAEAFAGNDCIIKGLKYVA